MDNKLQEPTDVDLSGSARGYWLVKVPKYLSEKWLSTNQSAEVGKLKWSKSRVPGGKPEVMFSVNQEFLKAAPDDGKPSKPIPPNHRFTLTGPGDQSLSVFSRESANAFDNEAGHESVPEKYSIEGVIMQRAECRPVVDPTYMQLKRVQLEESNKPAHKVVQLTGHVQTYKPVTKHVHHVQEEMKRKEMGRRPREERDIVKERLFGAFEKHQYYNVKDLVTLTNQPVTYVKELLKEICVYNTKPPHKNMWELKPEYRHYKSQSSSS